MLEDNYDHFIIFICRQFNNFVSCVGCTHSPADSRFPTNSMRMNYAGGPLTPRHLHMLCSSNIERKQLLHYTILWDFVRFVIYCFITTVPVAMNCAFSLSWKLTTKHSSKASWRCGYFRSKGWLWLLHWVNSYHRVCNVLWASVVHCISTWQLRLHVSSNTLLMEILWLLAHNVHLCA